MKLQFQQKWHIYMLCILYIWVWIIYSYYYNIIAYASDRFSRRQTLTTPNWPAIYLIFRITQHTSSSGLYIASSLLLLLAIYAYKYNIYSEGIEQNKHKQILIAKHTFIIYTSIELIWTFHMSWFYYERAAQHFLLKQTHCMKSLYESSSGGLLNIWMMQQCMNLSFCVRTMSNSFFGFHYFFSFFHDSLATVQGHTTHALSWNGRYNISQIKFVRIWQSSCQGTGFAA